MYLQNWTVFSVNLLSWINRTMIQEKHSQFHWTRWSCIRPRWSQGLRRHQRSAGSAPASYRFYTTWRSERKRKFMSSWWRSLSMMLRVSVYKPLWQTTGRRRERSTPERGCHSPSRWPSSLWPLSFLVPTADAQRWPSVGFKMQTKLQRYIGVINHKRA